MYGLAKVHKVDIALRPIVSMPGTSYHKIGQWISKWLDKIPESHIQTSTEDVRNSIKDKILASDEVLISFDVTQLYTFVPVDESIEMAAKKLYETTDEVPVDISTFIELAKMACQNILIKTHDGYMRQIEGLAMGIQPAPQLANIWMSAFDKKIQNDSCFYKRYMDDILTVIKKSEIEKTLERINSLHRNLSFTKEEENEMGEIPFLDLKIRHNKDGNIETEWYRKKTDTGLTINYHSMAPMKYKRSMAINLIHRIWNATSTWETLDKGIQEAKRILEYNQYPMFWYENIIHKTLEKLYSGRKKRPPEDEPATKMVFIQYRGKITDHFARKLKDTGAPIKVILTLTKVKTTVPSLKVEVEKPLASNLIYKYKCPHCQVSYVGMTSRHICTRISEHLSNGEKSKGPIMIHADSCKNSHPSPKDFIVLKKVQRSDIIYLSVMEALFIKE